MNKFRDEIIRTVADRENAPLGQYYYPSKTGSFTGILRYRCWHKNKPMLLCYFDSDDGNRYILPAWWQSWGVSYSPKESLINFADEVSNNTRWKCSFRVNEKGYVNWRTAVSR